MNMRSHPTRVRGLKRDYSTVDLEHTESHPTRVRRLKRNVT